MLSIDNYVGCLLYTSFLLEFYYLNARCYISNAVLDLTFVQKQFHCFLLTESGDIKKNSMTLIQFVAFEIHISQDQYSKTDFFIL